jgi:anti-sigma regulatory factor (Ser/Thr protein kinase)
MDHRFRITRKPDAVATARRHVMALVRTWQIGLSEERISDLGLLTSELITNAQIHAGGVHGIRVRWTGTLLRVEISDACGLAPLPRGSRPEDECGRGLGIVAALATSWGVDFLPSGKTVWFEIPAGEQPHDARREERTTMPEVPREEATDLYLNRGWSIGRLARSYGISHPGMRRKLRSWDVPLRSPGEQARLDAAARRRLPTREAEK